MSFFAVTCSLLAAASTDASSNMHFTLTTNVVTVVVSD